MSTEKPNKRLDLRRETVAALRIASNIKTGVTLTTPTGGVRPHPGPPGTHVQA